VCSVTNTLVLLTNRIVRWCRVLDLYGYVVETPVHPNARLALRAHRPTSPERWLHHVEELVFERHATRQDEQD
jgi:hypothetical protein